MEEMRNIKRYIFEFCKKNNINEEIFLIGNGSNSERKRLVYNCSKRKIPENCKFLVQYFRKINAVVIWDRRKYVQTTKVFSIEKEDVLKGFESGVVNKGVEYRAWKMAETFITNLENLENVLNNIIKKE